MTTGSASRFPIVKLAAKYNKMLSNGQVMSNRAAVDVIDHRVKQLLERIDLDEAPDRLTKLYELWNDYTNALHSGKEVEAVQLKAQIDDEFEKVYHDYMAWNQIFSALDLRGKMVEREIKVLKEIKAIMTAEDGYNMIAKVMAVTMRIIGDNPKKLKEIQYEYSRLIGESSDDVTKGFAENDGGDSDGAGGEERFGILDQEAFLHPGNEE